MTAQPPPRPTSLNFGDHRVRRGWVGVATVAGGFVMIAGPLLAEGAWQPLLALGPFCLLVAALCCITRTVAISPEHREVAVTHHLFRLRYTSFVRFDRFAKVSIWGYLFRRRYLHSDGTLEGDQVLMHYRLRLHYHRRWRLALAHVHDLAAVEDAARGLGRLLGLPAERQGYRLTRNAARRVLAVVDRHAREPL
jgi:hypothetical protein